MTIRHFLSGAFGAGVAFRNGLYDSGRLAVNALRGPVVSIGNISVGGSGKTPFTIYLGSLLKQRGIPFDIISRGYRRQTSGPVIVSPKGSPRDFGDEPVLMARELNVDVVVGEDRYQAGLLAERTWGPRLHLLDDAFQHRSLARQFDIVLISSEDLDDCLLPAGRLREPLSALSRADAVVITGDTPTAKLPLNVPLWRLTRNLYIEDAECGTDIPVGPTGSRTPSSDTINNVPPGDPLKPSFGLSESTKPLVFCGIAKPSNFFAQVRAFGITPAAELSFRDHHRYTSADIRRLLRIAELRHADNFITTAKDAINLESVWPENSTLPLRIAKLQLFLESVDAVLDTLLAKLSQRGKPAS